MSPKDRKPSITTRVRLRVSTFWGSTFDSRNRWIVLACLALLGFVLGFVGLRRMAIDGHGDSSVLTLLYRDLATLSFSTGNAGTGASIPWTYQVARFLLPVVVIYGAFAGQYQSQVGKQEFLASTREDPAPGRDDLQLLDWS